MSICDKWEGECIVVTGETMAVQRGLGVAMEAGLRNFIMEVDNMVPYHGLRQKKHEVSSYGLILQDIYKLCLQRDNVSFSFIRRNGNQAAHSLANMSLNVNELLVWLEEALPVVMDIVRADLVT
ncbi:60S ribosomal protein L18 [Bienertia sinuspersici]